MGNKAYKFRIYPNKGRYAALNLMLFSQVKIPREEGKSTPDQLVARLGMSRSSGSGQEATGSTSFHP